MNSVFAELSLTDMQKFLNEEARHFDRQFNKYPGLWILMFLYVALATTLLIVAILCNSSYRCTHDQQSVMLWFGLILLLIFGIFVILPNILRISLNCLYKEKKIPVKKMWPLTLVNPPKSQRALIKALRVSMAPR